MIECYKTTTEGTVRIDQPEQGCWISAIAPTEEERVWLENEVGIVPEFLAAALDDEESPHTDFDEDTKQILIILDCATIEDAEETVATGVNQYDTTPLSFLLIPETKTIVTISTLPNESVAYFTRAGLSRVNTVQRTRMLLQFAQHISQRYLVCLRDIYRQFTRTERKLRSTLSNKGLIRMLAFQRSLVYFSTSIKTDKAVLNKVRQGALVKLYTEDDELLDDVSIEFAQADEMCQLYASIINNTADAFSNVIDNNLNTTMRTLTMLTLVLAIPTIVFSFYGMNVDGLPYIASPLVPCVVAVIICAVVGCIFWWVRGRR